MLRVGYRIRLSSGKGPDREGVVTAVLGSMLRVRWPSQEETTVVPAAGSLTVIESPGEDASETAPPKKAASKKAAPKKAAPKKAASKKAAGSKKAAPTKKAAPKKAAAKKAAPKKAAATKKASKTSKSARRGNR